MENTAVAAAVVRCNIFPSFFYCTAASKDAALSPHCLALPPSALSFLPTVVDPPPPPPLPFLSLAPPPTLPPTHVLWLTFSVYLCIIQVAAAAVESAVAVTTTGSVAEPESRRPHCSKPSSVAILSSATVIANVTLSPLPSFPN
jgi:hypothetical protein